jgi:hypothetical protein
MNVMGVANMKPRCQHYTHVIETDWEETFRLSGKHDSNAIGTSWEETAIPSGAHDSNALQTRYKQTIRPSGQNDPKCNTNMLGADRQALQASMIQIQKKHVGRRPSTPEANMLHLQ